MASDGRDGKGDEGERGDGGDGDDGGNDEAFPPVYRAPCSAASGSISDRAPLRQETAPAPSHTFVRRHLAGGVSRQGANVTNG